MFENWEGGERERRLEKITKPGTSYYKLTTRYHSVDSINEDEMGRACGRNGKRKNAYGVGVEKVNYRDRFEGLRIYMG